MAARERQSATRTPQLVRGGPRLAWMEGLYGVEDVDAGLVTSVAVEGCKDTSFSASPSTSFGVVGDAGET
jgi:hypothetical protein